MNIHSRPLVIPAIAVLAILALSSPAGADAIRITGGTLDITSTGRATVTLTGERGFAMVGSAWDYIGGLVRPYTQCGQFQGCLPGTSVSLVAGASGGDLHNYLPISLDGVNYTNVGSASSPSSAALETAGSAILPSFASGTSAVVTAPFTLWGAFVYSPDFSTPPGTVELLGAGMATLTLHQGPSAIPGAGTVWWFDSAHYQFDDLPVPEPGSLILLGSGLGWLAIRKRRRGRIAACK